MGSKLRKERRFRGRIATTALCASLSLCSSCRSGKRQETDVYNDMASLDITKEHTARLKSFSCIYDRLPEGYVAETPSKIFFRETPVKFIEPNSGGDWSRIQTADGKTGYTKYENVKITPTE